MPCGSTTVLRTSKAWRRITFNSTLESDLSVDFRKPPAIMSGYIVIYVLAVILGLGIIGWFATPKGNQQTLIRTMILLSLTCCYLMWAITYLAQLHPIIAPKRDDLRPEAENAGHKLKL